MLTKSALASARTGAHLRRLAQYRQRLAQKKAATLPQLRDTLVVPDPDDPNATTLELDELCSFVLKKARKRWVWLALCRSTRQEVVAYAIGSRGAATCPKDCGNVSQKLIVVDVATAISGRHIGRLSRRSAMRRWARKAESWRTWSVGTTPCAQRLARFVRKTLVGSTGERNSPGQCSSRGAVA